MQGGILLFLTPKCVTIDLTHIYSWKAITTVGEIPPAEED